MARTANHRLAVARLLRLAFGYPSDLVKIRVKAIKVGNSIRVAIPSDILREASIFEGDTLLVDYDSKSHHVIMEKA